MTKPADALAASRVDLLALIVDGPPELEYVPGGEPWLLRGKRYLVYAPAGVGKSLALLVVGVAVIEAGGRVAILDVENGADEYARRLHAVLCGRDDLAMACAERLSYHAFPKFELSWSPESWATALAGSDLVIFDSSRKTLSSVGLAEDKSDDYTAFMNALVDPLSHAGVTTVVLDNTGHENGHPRGTSAKGDLNEVMYRLQVGSHFSLDRAGYLRMVLTRQRFAGLPEELFVRLGGGTYEAPAEPPEGQNGFRPTELMGKVMVHLGRTPGDSKRGVRSSIKGRNEYIDLALETLEKERYIEHSEKLKGYRVLRPWDEQRDLSEVGHEF